MISNRSLCRYWALPRNRFINAMTASPIKVNRSPADRKKATVSSPTWARKGGRRSDLRASFFSGTSAASANSLLAPWGNPLLSMRISCCEQNLTSLARKVSKPVSHSTSCCVSNEMVRIPPPDSSTTRSTSSVEGSSLPSFHRPDRIASKVFCDRCSMKSSPETDICLPALMSILDLRNVE